MATRSPDTIRNLLLAGHGTSGKTTLAESLLSTAGAITRPGRVEDGNTVCDYDALEKERQHSIDLAVSYLERAGVLVHLIDTPGYRDFIGQVYSAAPATDCMVVVVGDDGVRPNTRKVWELAEELRLPRFVVISRLDREHADYESILSQVQEQLSPRCLPLAVPDASGPAFSKVELTLGNPAASEAAKAAANNLLEAIVESNDELMARYLEGEELSNEEVSRQLVEAISSASVFPVLVTSALKGIGIEELLDAMVRFAPPASRDLGRKAYAINSEGTPAGDQVFAIKTRPEDPFCALVFKVISDPYVGKLSLLRIFSGSIAQNGNFFNPHSGKTERIGKIVRLQGKEQLTVESAGAGEIAALVKVENLKNFDLITSDKRLAMAPPRVPTPMCSMAVAPKSKADEKKFAESYLKIIDEDVTLRAARDRRTNELVISGMSQLHLHTLWERLKSRYGVEVTTKQPKTPYLETITVKGDDHYRHKKQTGGAGEFAEVWLRVEPLERGAGHDFANEVFGGAISASYVQSAEKGIRAVMEQGVIAGYPVVDVKVAIYDGKEHPVDSKDIAFQKAGREAFKLAIEKAKPVLLEPIVNLEVTFPAEFTGDIQGDLNRRRGRVVGVDSLGSLQILKAQVPLAEIADYASSLGSMTGGQGTYGIEMSHYEVVPPNIQQKVVETAKAEMQKEG
jgi:elongation factor G